MFTKEKDLKNPVDLLNSIFEIPIKENYLSL